MPTLSITYTAAEGNRIAAAYGDKLDLAQPATQAQVKAALVAEVKSVVRGYEAQQAHAAVVVATDIEPT
jgi:hypothetical protein